MEDAAKVREVIDEIIDDLIIYGMDEIVVKRGNKTDILRVK